VPLIIYINQTLLSKNEKVIEHPIYLLFANIAYEQRYISEGQCLLAILLYFSTQNLSVIQKLQAFQNCLDHVLTPK